MAIVAHAPEGLKRFAALDEYCRHGTELTPRQRELAILVATRDVHYGWGHHVPLARALGVSDEDIHLIREGRTPRDLEPAERAVCDYAFEITACRTVPPRVQEAVLQQLNPRQIVDAALLTAFYMATAALTIAFDVPLETPETLQAELRWETRLASAGDGGAGRLPD
jgi:4-carboxymuconolactone decarboxylase